MQPERSSVCCISEFIRLRGSGPYDEPTILEAALLIEECSGVVLTDSQMSAQNLGSAQLLGRFARSLVAGER